MNKMEYRRPQADLVRFANEDIITTSLFDFNPGDTWIIRIVNGKGVQYNKNNDGQWAVRDVTCTQWGSVWEKYQQHGVWKSSSGPNAD